jgi:hypothetical protein
MRPFRSRALTALVTAILSLGLLGTVAFADDIPITSAPADPPPTVVVIPATTTSFPEDPWGLPTVGFPEDPWPGL